MRISKEQAASLLNDGEVIAAPTETVYGLAASLSHPTAISKIFSLKGRPANNPLIIHVADTYQILPYIQGEVEAFSDLAAAFWPGPMTLVLPVKEGAVPSVVRAGLPNVAFRVPAHPLARQLLKETGPLVMPSANLSGSPSSTCREHVESDFGDSFPVLDGGVCLKGLESTILYFFEEKWKIIRQGALPAEAFLPILHYLPEVVGKMEGETPICPGQLFRHYAPQSNLELTGVPLQGSVVVGFDDRQYPRGCKLFSLGVSTDSELAAKRLYAVLRKLDENEIKNAWVDMAMPNDGIWQALKERLIKAACK